MVGGAVTNEGAHSVDEDRFKGNAKRKAKHGKSSPGENICFKAGSGFLMKNLADSRCLTMGLAFRRGKKNGEGGCRLVAGWLLGRGSGMSGNESEKVSLPLH